MPSLNQLIDSPTVPVPVSDPVQGLLELGAALVEGRQPPRHVAEWFAGCLARWLAKESGLDVCLGLKSNLRGHESALGQFTRRRRNAAIREAAALIELEEGASAWRRAKALEQEIYNFECRIWPSWRHLAAPPTGTSSLRCALFRARKIGSLPGTARRLHDLITWDF